MNLGTVSFLIALVILSACKRTSHDIVGPVERRNPTVNPSFEQNGLPSRTGWEVETGGRAVALRGVVL